MEITYRTMLARSHGSVIEIGVSAVRINPTPVTTSVKATGLTSRSSMTRDTRRAKPPCCGSREDMLPMIARTKVGPRATIPPAMCRNRSTWKRSNASHPRIRDEPEPRVQAMTVARTSRHPRRVRVEHGEAGTPKGIRTPDLHLERVASWASRRWGPGGPSLSGDPPRGARGTRRACARPLLSRGAAGRRSAVFGPIPQRPTDRRAAHQQALSRAREARGSRPSRTPRRRRARRHRPRARRGRRGSRTRPGRRARPGKRPRRRA